MDTAHSLADDFPPPGYVQSESKLEGIEIFKPAPLDLESHAPVVNFNCPRCGAITAYSIEDGGLKCTHCGYIERPQSQIAISEAQAFEFTVETMDRVALGWGEARKELACQNCGAKITLPIDVISTTCPFCGSNQVIQREAPQDSLRPRFLKTFSIDERSCQGIISQFLAGSWMVPRELVKLSRKPNFTPMYLPFWSFDATAGADWKAEVGHTETERFYNHSKKTWDTRVKVVWRWESGHVVSPFKNLLVTGTNRLSPLLLGRISKFDVHSLQPYEPKFLAGLHALSYDIPLNKSWETSRGKMRELVRQACINQASTNRVRNFSMELDFKNETWRYILLPVYLATYSFHQKNYQVLINGQNGKISGQRPVDWGKIWSVCAVLLLPGIILGISGLFFSGSSDTGFVLSSFGFILGVFALVIDFLIFSKAQRFDDA